MNIDVIKEAIFVRTTSALTELMKGDADLAVVRDKLCDAAQFTYFREDGTRTDQLIPVPVPHLTDEEIRVGKVLLKTQLVHLTQGDVDVLDGSRNRSVRRDILEDVEVKRLYDIYKSL